MRSGGSLDVANVGRMADSRLSDHASADGSSRIRQCATSLIQSCLLWSLQVILSPDPAILNLKLWPPQDNCGGGATEVGRLRQVESITVKVLAILWVIPQCFTIEVQIHLSGCARSSHVCSLQLNIVHD